MSELTRTTQVLYGVRTWAVHDGRICVHLAVTVVNGLPVGVFSCAAAPDGEPCPWLGTCSDRDAYVSRVARPIHDAARESGWDDTVIYGLLEQLHASEAARAGEQR